MLCLGSVFLNYVLPNRRRAQCVDVALIDISGKQNLWHFLSAVSHLGTPANTLHSIPLMYSTTLLHRSRTFRRRRRPTNETI